jgi:hypothetical protein
VAQILGSQVTRGPGVEALERPKLESSLDEFDCLQVEMIKNQHRHPLRRCQNGHHCHTTPSRAGRPYNIRVNCVVGVGRRSYVALIGGATSWPNILCASRARREPSWRCIAVPLGGLRHGGGAVAPVARGNGFAERLIGSIRRGVLGSYRRFRRGPSTPNPAMLRALLQRRQNASIIG